MRAWNRPSVVLAFAAWLSVFVLGWMMALGHLAPRGFTLWFWIFCVVVATIASAVSGDRGVVIESREVLPGPLRRAGAEMGMEPGPFPIEFDRTEED